MLFSHRESQPFFSCGGFCSSRRYIKHLAAREFYILVAGHISLRMTAVSCDWYSARRQLARLWVFTSHQRQRIARTAPRSRAATVFEPRPIYFSAWWRGTFLEMVRPWPNHTSGAWCRWSQQVGTYIGQIREKSKLISSSYLRRISHFLFSDSKLMVFLPSFTIGQYRRDRPQVLG